MVEEVTSDSIYYEVGGERKKTVPFTVELREWLIIAHKIGLVFLDTLQDIRLLTIHQQGMVCGCFENLAIYQFNELSEDADDGENVIKPDNAFETGRWLIKAKLDSGYNELVFKEFRTDFPTVGNPLYLYIARDTRYIYWWNPTTNTYHNAITNFASQSFFSENSGKLGGELPSHYYNLARLIDCITAGTDIGIDSTTIAGKIIISYTGSVATQIQVDWNQTDNTALDYIKNKPSIPESQIQSDWNQADNTQVDFIKNKPTTFPPSAHGHMDSEVELTETYTGNLSGATTQKEANDILDSLVGGVLETNLVASNELKFDTLNQYGTIASARTGDITVNFTDAKLGVVQVMFHDDSAIPAEILSNAKFIILQGYYTPDSVNRLSFELVDKTAGSEKILISIIPTE